MSWSVTVKEDFKKELTYVFCMREIFEMVKGIPKNLKYEVVNNPWDLRTWLAVLLLIFVEPFILVFFVLGGCKFYVRKQFDFSGANHQSTIYNKTNLNIWKRHIEGNPL